MANGNGNSLTGPGAAPGSVPQAQDPDDSQGSDPGSSGPPPGPISPDQTFNQLSAAHDQAKAMFDHTSDLFDKIRPIRNALDALAKKGDVVDTEDVIKTASKIVSSGAMTPNDMAKLLAQMPSGGSGPALAQWVQRMDQQMQMQEQQLEQGHAIARHEMGVSAMRLLQYAAQAGPGRINPQGPGASPGGANALTSQSAQAPSLAQMVPQGNA